MVEYRKTPFTYQQHLELLQSRGLTVNDPEQAIQFLTTINYYRFTGYCIPFQKPRDTFIPGTTFEQISELYRLDEQLRSAVFSLVGSIEIFLRTNIAYELSHKWGAFVHSESKVFQDPDDHAEWITELEEAILESKEPFLRHYKEKYTGFPRLPIWMACEIMSFGKVSKCYNGLTRDARLLICSFSEVDHNVFRTWLHTITFVRNICAHHGRLWSRNITISPLIPDKHPSWQTSPLINKKLFTAIIIMEWVCRKARLPVTNVASVYEIMQKISDIDPRFSSWMGIPSDRIAALFWDEV